MKEFIIDLVKGISAALLSILAAVLVVVIGGLLVGYGIHKEWQWLINSGVFLAVLGLLFIFRWWLDD